jgi:uncharacterized protein (DUF58 family)
LTLALTGSAEQLAARLPPLMVAADRVAATVAQGVHGRRRVGTGDSFWQFRPFVDGDTPSRIDWRQSAKSDRTFIRDMEWEAAQTVCLWRAASPSMSWRSGRALPEKRERAELLLLALASLLVRAGEQVRLIGVPGRVFRGRSAVEGIARQLPGGDELPPRALVPARSCVVLMGDFLAPLPEIRAAVAILAALPVRGHILQVLDPAELSLPYEGRVKFRGMAGEGETVIPRVDGVRAAYAEALAAQRDGLATICRAAGWSFATHRTDASPESALLSLFMALDAGRVST